MIYRVLSEPHVYISIHYRNVQGAVLEQTTLERVYPTPAVHSPSTVVVPPVPLHTTGLVVGEWRGKDKSYFDYASLIDTDSFQVSCHFPDLLMCLHL